MAGKVARFRYIGPVGEVSIPALGDGATVKRGEVFEVPDRALAEQLEAQAENYHRLEDGEGERGE